MAAQRSILDLWPDLVDHRTGIVREISELPIDDDDPPFAHFLSAACTTEAFGFLANFGNNGGAGATPGTAIAKALGEAVERYSAAMFDYDEFVWAPYDRLDEPATAPSSFALYLPSQHQVSGFPWRPFTPSSPLAWTRGRSLVSGNAVLVPAAFVHVPYHYRADRPDTPITQPISTGLACGSSLTQATLSALCEVVERDAFTLMWQAQLSRPRIRLDSLPAALADLVGRFHAVDLTVHLIDISTNVACPVIMSVCEGFAATSPALAFAAAAHPDPVVAARKSLEELAHTRRFAAQVMDYLPPVPVDIDGGHPAVDGQRAHLRFYCPQESKEPARFAWTGDRDTGEVDLAAVGTAGPPGRDADILLTRLIDEIAGTGADVVACDLTTPDVAELGLSVMRVVVPSFHPLQMGHANRCLGGPRLAAAGRSGWSAEHDNPYPHPFP